LCHLVAQRLVLCPQHLVHRQRFCELFLERLDGHDNDLLLLALSVVDPHTARDLT